ncbi:hypothetical protein EVAR_28491_1 [Eumeta japonica]|uniref:Uncharacterized protein n=1 Tax=Eumeta variegata TaxID=151549 RepID=A0A4C1WS61_EUMVA|nr:hypothetical protein EVAR_28491_1 [Eumeta japonica]
MVRATHEFHYSSPRRPRLTTAHMQTEISVATYSDGEQKYRGKESCPSEELKAAGAGERAHHVLGVRLHPPSSLRTDHLHGQISATIVPSFPSTVRAALDPRALNSDFHVDPGFDLDSVLLKLIPKNPYSYTENTRSTVTSFNMKRFHSRL